MRAASASIPATNPQNGSIASTMSPVTAMTGQQEGRESKTRRVKIRGAGGDQQQRAEAGQRDHREQRVTQIPRRQRDRA